ncbi:MAG: hypothetical protein EU544_02820 [Promethearchaeota archaeon]|nr:MAG: hypothetical protein EU544_02820 [Candidatus Lokiarchaeota archaeon]
MNELSILMHLLSKKDTAHQKGANKDEIFTTLNLKDKNKEVHFNTLITQLARYIHPLGLEIRFNPLDGHWFLSFEQDISDLLQANPFEDKPKLAATLFCVLTCCMKNFGAARMAEIEKLRKKKTTLQDLKELENMGFLELDDDQSKVSLTPLIGYQLDLEKLFIKLALNAKQ